METPHNSSERFCYPDYCHACNAFDIDHCLRSTMPQAKCTPTKSSTNTYPVLLRGCGSSASVQETRWASTLKSASTSSSAFTASFSLEAVRFSPRRTSEKVSGPLLVISLAQWTDQFSTRDRAKARLRHGGWRLSPATSRDRGRKDPCDPEQRTHICGLSVPFIHCLHFSAVITALVLMVQARHVTPDAVRRLGR